MIAGGLVLPSPASAENLGTITWDGDILDPDGLIDADVGDTFVVTDTGGPMVYVVNGDSEVSFAGTSCEGAVGSCRLAVPTATKTFEVDSLGPMGTIELRGPDSDGNPLLGTIVLTASEDSGDGGDPDPAIALVEPSTARDFEVVTLEVTGVNPVGATVEFVQGADAYSAEVIDTSGDTTSGTIDVLVPEFDWSGIDSSGLTFPMSYEEFVDEINTAGELEFDVEVTNGADAATLVDGFTIQPPAMLINDYLRSGGCGAGEPDTGIFAMSSVMPWGTLAQPAYKSDDGNWYTLTYDDSDSCDELLFGIYGDPDTSYPLDFGLGSGVTGSEWHGSTVVDTDDGSEDIVDDGKFRMHLDASGFTVSGAEGGVAKGFGTLISEGTVQGGDPEVPLSVSHEYILGEEARFIKITTVISNDQAGELVENVNTWV